MPYNQQLANRIREAMVHQPNAEEKQMFGGTCFMMNGKMCVGVVRDEMMCRIDPELYEQALERTGCREMDFNGKPMKGYVYVAAEGMASPKDFEHWIGLCLAFNGKAKASKKKK